MTTQPDIPKTIPVPGFTFHIEAWTHENNFTFNFNEVYSLSSTSESENIYACAATSTIKKKFRFPAQDPSENDVTDTRTDIQKINDIIRVWSQVLTPAEQLLWDEIAERNLSHDISLSGIRTPKALIDDEIKKYRNLNASTQKQLLQSLAKAPSDIVSPLSTSQPVPASQEDPLSIMPGKFQVHETFASNFCAIPTNLACSTESCEHADPAVIEHLLEECHQEVKRIRNCSRPKAMAYFPRQ